MRDLHDTQPSPGLQLRRDDGLRAPPRWLFIGVIAFFLLLALGAAGIVFGFREVLRPAQQQRIIDQLPFMRVLRQPTPVGGVFPTLDAPAADSDALALLDLPLAFPSPTSASGSVAVITATPAAPPATATIAPTAIVAPTATVATRHCAAQRLPARPRRALMACCISNKLGTTADQPRLRWR